MRRVTIHSFAKFLVDLAIVLFWIWVPMFYFNLKASEHAIWIWILDIGTLAVLMYFLHSKGRHKP